MPHTNASISTCIESSFDYNAFISILKFILDMQCINWEIKSKKLQVSKCEKIRVCQDNSDCDR